MSLGLSSNRNHSREKLPHLVRWAAATLNLRVVHRVRNLGEYRVEAVTVRSTDNGRRMVPLHEFAASHTNAAGEVAICR